MDSGMVGHSGRRYLMGKMTSVVYLFRVHNLMAFANYAGSSSAGDVESQAISVARKQESKMFAVFAPPPLPAMPTAIPAPEPTPTPLPAAPPVSAAPIASAPDTAVAPTAPYCRSGEQPQFHFGFATLSAQLGSRMGTPTSCEYNDPNGSGDVLQSTDTGLAVYRAATATATFTNGAEHWALSGSSVVHWTASSLDPPADAELVAG
jgi:hypothetical protein